MVQQDALNQSLIDGRAVKTSQIREKMALIRFGNLRVLSGNRVIEENDVIVFAAAQGRFLFQQLEAADAAFRGSDVKSGHGRYSPLSLGRGDQDDGGVISSACQVRLQDQREANLVKGSVWNGQDEGRDFLSGRF
jgi:hypothetical protein